MFLYNKTATVRVNKEDWNEWAGFLREKAPAISTEKVRNDNVRENELWQF